MVRTQHLHHWGPGLIPSWKTKIPQAERHGQKIIIMEKKKKRRRPKAKKQTSKKRMPGMRGKVRFGANPRGALTSG